MNPRSLPFTLPLLLAVACASPGRSERREHSHEIELRELQQAQQVFREQNTVPQVFDFEGHGRVTVRDISLDGFPGGTYLRCRFHYQNRTEKPVVQAWVSLDVLDADKNPVATQTANCIVPIPIPIARGSYYSDELRAPTLGVHLQPGWSWRIRCVADPEQADEPLNPPAEERTLRQSAPMHMKDRAWPYYGPVNGR